MPLERTVWLDCDPGFDDWLAMLLLTQCPSVHWVGMSVVAGNAPLAITLDNALRISSFHGWPVPVHAGSAQPLQGALETAQSILGAQGMRTTGMPLPATTRQAASQDAVGAMLAYLRSSSQPITLMATGPLTNIALAIEQDRVAMSQAIEIILMGGSTDRGNHTPAAEFNIFADPLAASLVFASGIPIRMFGLNLCRQLLLTHAHVQAIKAMPGAHAQIVAGYLDAYQRIRSRDGSVPMPLYDPAVALWLHAPELFEFQQAPVDVELQGQFTRGMTVCDLHNRSGRASSVNIAMAVKADSAMAIFVQLLEQAMHQPAADLLA
jgi:purine nucleosidase